MTEIKPTIKYESQLDPGFSKWMVEMPGGEQIRHCIQCGTCSATCPMSLFMDLTPRRLIQMTREGFKEEVLSSFTIWLCASCYGCTVNCPRGIKVTDIMYALKRRAIQENRYPHQKFPIPVLARAFLKMVRSRGRASESWLVIRLNLKTGIMKFAGMARLGMNLLRTGRFSLKVETIERRKELQKILDGITSRTKEAAI